ncbi:energy-coupling factor transporter transmembrane component T family protein [Ornithinimicrobium murale]|uniref:energy-coupling factor transporter transmembrane component T family protein n=1 Tax=Ornithinimicrobium murale TaxID=1050153 RepID=UPI000E0D12FC|nr:energy-coupling factor transporter transmembrane component T [Ornithinimicrobium murale]
MSIPALGPPAGRAAGSVLARRNPTVKLMLLFVVSAVLAVIFDPVTPAVLYVLAAAAVIASTGMELTRLALLHLPFIGFGLGVFLVNALSRPGDVWWTAGPLRITVEGLSVGGSLALRTLVIGVLAIGFITSTDGVRLMHSLHQQGRLGPRVTYAVLAGYRMLQEMPREWQTIRHAHAVRAPLRPDGAPSRSPLAFGRGAFALLVISVRKGERMALSLESRGLGLSPRTTWRRVPLTGADWAMAAGVLGVLATVVVTSRMLGHLRGVEALLS